MGIYPFGQMQPGFSGVSDKAGQKGLPLSVFRACDGSDFHHRTFHPGVRRADPRDSGKWHHTARGRASRSQEPLLSVVQSRIPRKESSSEIFVAGRGARRKKRGPDSAGGVSSRHRRAHRAFQNRNRLHHVLGTGTRTHQMATGRMPPVVFPHARSAKTGN